MGYWKYLMMESESPRFCLSTEDYREECEKRDFYKNMRIYCTNTIEEKFISL